METYQELKKRQQAEVNNFEGIFFAFNEGQFQEGMKEIISLGAGGYIRKDRHTAFIAMFKRHTQEKIERAKEEKFLLDSLIYELGNHEFCITLDVTDALDALGYTKEEIDPKVLKKAMAMSLN